MAGGPLFGDDGHRAEDWPEANGEALFCQPSTLRMSAEVCRRGRFVGGEATVAKGCGGGGGGGTCDRKELGEDCAVFAPMEPYLRGVMDK